MKKSTHGGSRKGAGRKPKNGVALTERIFFRVSKQTRDQLKEINDNPNEAARGIVIEKLSNKGDAK